MIPLDGVLVAGLDRHLLGNLAVVHVAVDGSGADILDGGVVGGRTNVDVAACVALSVHALDVQKSKVHSPSPWKAPLTQTPQTVAWALAVAAIAARTKPVEICMFAVVETVLLVVS